MSEAATQAPAGTAKGATEVRELTPLQQSTARAVAESKATAPHVYFSADLDFRPCEGLIAGGPGAASVGDLLIRASALALRDAPLINGAYRDGHFELYSRINVAFALAARDSVVLPVIHDADSKDLARIAAEARELGSLAQDGSITRPQLAGATFTVITAEAERYTPIITRGQAATLGAGAPRQGAIAVEEGLLAGPVLTLTLACDARIIQTGEGAAFLAAIVEHLSRPDGL
jgi:pyruvate dehydrogenase E2 component (dihydrolipoamide acetyltransferase)